MIAWTAAFSLAVESLQYFLISRSSEQQDVVLNILSGAIGVALYREVTRRTQYSAS